MRCILLDLNDCGDADDIRKASKEQKLLDVVPIWEKKIINGLWPGMIYVHMGKILEDHEYGISAQCTIVGGENSEAILYRDERYNEQSLEIEL